jgi:hypothetical protein
MPDLALGVAQALLATLVDPRAALPILLALYVYLTYYSRKIKAILV